MRRGVRAAGVLLVVVIAGCSGLPGLDSRPSVTVTPVEVPGSATPAGPTTPTTTPEGTPFSDPSGMAAAHRAALANTSYTVIVTQTIRFPANGRAGEWRLIGRYAADGPVLVETVRDGSVFGPRAPIRADYWSDGRVIVEAFSPNGSRTVNVVEARRYAIPPPTVAPTDPQLEGELARVLAATRVRTLTRVVPAGEPYERVRITATGPAPGTRSPQLDPGAAVTNLTARLVIDERGLVHAYHLRYDAWLAGEPVSVTRTVRYVAIGATVVERPAWAVAALNGTATPASSSRDTS